MTALDYVQVYRAGSLTVPGNGTAPSGVDIPFTSAVHDPDGYWDSSTKLIIPAGKGGVPFLVWGVTFSNDQPAVDGNFQTMINGAVAPGGVYTYIRQSEQASPYGLGWFSTAPTIIVPADGDEITLTIWNDGGVGNASIQILYSRLHLLRLAV